MSLKWCKHNKINPKQNTVFKCKCEVCGNNFQATMNRKNIKKVDERMWLGGKTVSDKSGFLSSGPITTRHNYDKVIQLLSVCSNCGNEVELGCIPNGTTYEDYQWYCD